MQVPGKRDWSFKIVAAILIGATCYVASLMPAMWLLRHRMLPWQTYRVYIPLLRVCQVAVPADWMPQDLKEVEFAEALESLDFQ